MTRTHIFHEYHIGPVISVAVALGRAYTSTPGTVVLAGVEAPTVAMNCLRFELHRHLRPERDGDQPVPVPPVRVLSTCEWFKESQEEIKLMDQNIMSGLEGPSGDGGCLFGDINAPCRQRATYCVRVWVQDYLTFLVRLRSHLP